MSAQSSLIYRTQSCNPHLRARFRHRSLARRQTVANAHTTLKGELRIRRDQQETPHALQEAEPRSWLRFGEAYSALRDWRPISGRSSLPIRRAMFRERRSFQLRGTQLQCPATTWVEIPRRNTEYREENPMCQISLNARRKALDSTPFWLARPLLANRRKRNSDSPSNLNGLTSQHSPPGAWITGRMAIHISFPARPPSFVFKPLISKELFSTFRSHTVTRSGTLKPFSVR